jgi:hypothetical protein
MEGTPPPVRIVTFPTGEELSDEQASSGPFVFAASDADTLFAFENESANGLLERWADEHEFGDRVAAARAAATAQPEHPEVDAEAERAEVEELNERLRAYSARIGVPIEAPEFIARAHDDGIFDSACLYAALSYGLPAVGLTTSCTDIRRYLPIGALSARSYGYNIVLLYDQPNYGPLVARRTPLATLVYSASVVKLPRPALSIFFN